MNEDNIAKLELAIAKALKVLREKLESSDSGVAQRWADVVHTLVRTRREILCTHSSEE